MTTLNVIGAHVYSNPVVGGGGAIYYVRADGIATDATLATDPSAVGTSLNLQTLYDELDADNIPAGSTIMLSDQGGDYAQTNVNFTEQLGNFSPATSVGMLWAFEGITYTNVPGEDVLLDATGILGGTDDLVPPKVFLGTGTVGVCTFRAGATGSITIDGDGSIALVEMRNSCGAGGAGYGIKCINLTCLGNANTSQVHDIYSTSETSEMEVIGGTVTDNFRVGYADVPGSDQVFTTHVTSKMRASDVVVDGCTYLFTCIGGSTCELNNITSTGVASHASLLSVGESTVVLNDCNLEFGSNNNSKFIGGAAGTTGSLTLNNCDLVTGTGTDLGDTLAGTDTTVTFNGGSITWSQDVTITMQENADLEYNDVTHVYLNASGTRRYYINSATNRVTFNRCILDYRNAAGTPPDLVRLDADVTMKAGSGMFACEVWQSKTTGLFNKTNANYTNPDTGFNFEQCTFLDCGELIRFSVGDNVSSCNVHNCHFSDNVGGTMVRRGNVSATWCSFYAAAWDLRTQIDTLDGNEFQVSAEGFTDRTYDLSNEPDLTIDDTSDMHLGGGAPTLTYDRTGTVLFATPNASTGCYEVP